MSGATLRSCPQVSKSLGPEKYEWPAALTGGQFDRDATSPGDLAQDVFLPVVVECHVLEPAERRADLAAPEVQRGARPGDRAGPVRIRIDFPVGRDYPFAGKMREQSTIHRHQRVPLRRDEVIHALQTFRTYLCGIGRRQEYPTVAFHVKLRWQIRASPRPGEGARALQSVREARLVHGIFRPDQLDLLKEAAQREVIPGAR